MGSVGIAAWIARVAFVALLAWGWTTGEPRRPILAWFAVAGAAVWIGLALIPNGSLFVTPALAIVDIVLVLAVFRGDVRIG